MDENLLKIRRSLPLLDKILLTKRRIYEFYHQTGGKCYLAFSGGKDSTVLSHLVINKLEYDGMTGSYLSEAFPDIPHIFCNTGVEWAAQVRFVRDYCKNNNLNLIELKPKKSFFQIVKEYGYPMISKEHSQRIEYIRKCLQNERFSKTYYHWLMKLPYAAMPWLNENAPKLSNKCCFWLKKEPSRRFEKETGLRPILGVRAEESRLREQRAKKQGCIFERKDGLVCHPISFWTQKDVDDYISYYEIELSDMYEVYWLDRTGCIGCLYGCKSYEDIMRKLGLLRELRPKQYDWYLKNGLNQIIDYSILSGKLSTSELKELKQEFLEKGW